MRDSICIFRFPMRSERLHRHLPRSCRPRSGTTCLLLGFVLLGALAGCAHPRTEPETPIVRTQPSAQPHDPALALLDYAHHLATISPAAREKTVKAARAHAHANPNAVAYARLAIALGTPGQKLYTPDEAARYARQALKMQPAPWNIDARQYLSDYARLYTNLTADTGQHSADNTATPAAAQIRRLRAELDEAHQKLRALAHIEEHLDSTDEGN